MDNILTSTDLAPVIEPTAPKSPCFKYVNDSTVFESSQAKIAKKLTFDFDAAAPQEPVKELKEEPNEENKEKQEVPSITVMYT